MSIQVKTKYLVFALLGFVLATFVLGLYLGHRKAQNASVATINALKFELSQKTIELNKKTIYLTQTEQALATQKDLVKAGVIEREELRKLNIKHVNEINKLNLQIDTLLQNVDHNGVIIITQQSTIDSLTAQTVKKEQKAILLPFSFNKTDEFTALAGNFDKDGVLGISLKMDVPLDVITGISKETKKPFINVTTPNSYIRVLSIKSYSTDIKKPTRFGVGLNVGYGLILGDPVKTAPYIGAGLSYNFIRF